MQMKRAPNEIYTVWDNLYFSLQLYVLNCSEKNVNMYLQFARFWAPAILGWATAKAAFLILKDKIDALRISIYHDHVIICGLGRKGMQFVNEYANDDNLIVVIEANDDNQYISSCEERRGVIVLIGDASDSRLLYKAGVKRASLIYSVTGYDYKNIEIAFKVSDQLEEARNKGMARSHNLQCLIHVFDMRLRSICEEHSLFTMSHDRFNARIFNICEECARFIIHKHRPDLYDKPIAEKALPPISILIVGFGWAGESLLKQIIRFCHYPDKQLVRIRIIDLDAERKGKVFLSNYPHILPLINEFQYFDIAFINKDIQHIGTIIDLKDLDIEPGDTPQNIFICLRNDTLGFSSAIKLYSFFIHPPKIVVVMESGVTELFDSTKLNQKYENIHAFDMVEHTCPLIVKASGTIDLLARMTHTTYISDYLGFSGNKDKTNYLKPEEQKELWEAIDGYFNNHKSADTPVPDNYIRDIFSAQQGDIEKRPKLTNDDYITKLNMLLRLPNLYDLNFKDAFNNNSISKYIDRAKQAVEDTESFRQNDFYNLLKKQQEQIVRMNFMLIWLAFEPLCPDLLKKKSSFEEWDKLPEELKNSNRWVADHMTVKLRAMGFDDLSMVNPEEIEQKLKEKGIVDELSRIEHRRWMAEKFIGGWSYAKNCKEDPIRKIHSCLCEYDELSDNDKKKDLDQIQSIPRLIKSLVEEKKWQVYLDSFNDKIPSDNEMDYENGI